MKALGLTFVLAYFFVITLPLIFCPLSKPFCGLWPFLCFKACFKPFNLFFLQPSTYFEPWRNCFHENYLGMVKNKMMNEWEVFHDEIFGALIKLNFNSSNNYWKLIVLEEWCEAEKDMCFKHIYVKKKKIIRKRKRKEVAHRGTQ